MPFRAYTGYRAAYVEIPLGGSGMRAAPFDSPDEKRSLVRRLNAIDGIDIGEDLSRFPGIDLPLPGDGDRLEQFLEVMSWAVARATQAYSERTA